MFYVIDGYSQVMATENVRPAPGAYSGFTVVYSEENHLIGDTVDPDEICTRFIKSNRPFIAGDGLDIAVIEISDYGVSTELDVNGDPLTVELQDNYAVLNLVSEVPPVDLVIMGVDGPLAEVECRVYVR
jgi:hypothetical protein